MLAWGVEFMTAKYMKITKGWCAWLLDGFGNWKLLTNFNRLIVEMEIKVGRDAYSSYCLWAASFGEDYVC